MTIVSSYSAKYKTTTINEKLKLANYWIIIVPIL
ncbi:hypothetical protein BXY64_1421 [Marinifilum flexuosum]|uniref:Uncharacterized protein n=1 Tax=Marinifilum flexuosum TaxID=1117708 RepID=A0A419X9I9_9BACT|nr:hypothetical protein BXY64_1421 [Marinifilum flexuosum]